MTTKRSRGRPPGTGKNDTPDLAQVADVIVADPKLKPTTAMKRVIAKRKEWQESDATLLRRWQGKWKEAGAALLTAAKERAANNLRSSAGYAPTSYVGSLYENGPEWRAMNAARALSEAVMRPLRAIEESPAFKIMQHIENSPEMKAMREMKRLQNLYDPLILREIREQERIMRDLIDPFSFGGKRYL